MYLCERCKKSQLEICQYFIEHFLETEDRRPQECPEFEEDDEEEDLGWF